MKVFWALIGLLAIITAALLVGGGEQRQDKMRSESPDSGAPPAYTLSEGPQHAPLTTPADSDAMLPDPAAPESGAPSSVAAVEPPIASGASADPETAAASEPTSPAGAEAAAAPTGSDGPAIGESAADAGSADTSGAAPRGGGEPAAPNSAGGAAPVLQPNAPAEVKESTSGQSESVKKELDSLIDDLTKSAKETDPAEAGSKPGESSASSDSEAAEGPAATPAPGEGLPAAAPDPLKPEIVASKFEEREDGSTLVDGRFVIRGKGTKEEPYQVTWDMLVATAELYDPRRNRLKLPERVKMLDGKYVTIVGYVAFPIVAEGANEMLAMLNSWDGCCIGVPPTPYDAVEVRLRADATAEQMLMNWGSVTGRFKVEPYLAANWLLGLYLMEDAVLKAEGM